LRGSGLGKCSGIFSEKPNYVSIPLRGSGLGKSSLTNPYPAYVSGDKSTHRLLTLNKRGVKFNKQSIEPFETLAGTPIDARQRKIVVRSISRTASIPVEKLAPTAQQRQIASKIYAVFKVRSLCYPYSIKV
jgi:hypothetical protein